MSIAVGSRSHLAETNEGDVHGKRNGPKREPQRPCSEKVLLPSELASFADTVTKNAVCRQGIFLSRARNAPCPP